MKDGFETMEDSLSRIKVPCLVSLKQLVTFLSRDFHLRDIHLIHLLIWKLFKLNFARFILLFFLNNQGLYFSFLLFALASYFIYYMISILSYYIMLYIISYYIVLYHKSYIIYHISYDTSSCIMSYHVMSCHALCHTIYHILSFHVIYYNIISYHIMSYLISIISIISYYIISYQSYTISYHIIYHMIYHIMPYHII